MRRAFPCDEGQTLDSFSHSPPLEGAHRCLCPSQRDRIGADTCRIDSHFCVRSAAEIRAQSDSNRYGDLRPGKEMRRVELHSDVGKGSSEREICKDIGFSICVLISLHARNTNNLSISSGNGNRKVKTRKRTTQTRKLQPKPSNIFLNQ